jgi:hypothetical protein
MVTLSPLAGAGWQFFDNNGVILSGGKLYTYVAGTTTPATTYTSSSGVTPHANPIILDSSGRVSSEVWLNTAISYKFTLATANNVTLWTKDDISGASSAAEFAAFVASLASPTGASLVGYNTGTVKTALDTLLGDRGPVLIAITGQSNAVGVFAGGDNPLNPLVKTWNPTNSTWVSGGQYTAAPWTSTAPTGNSSKNNFALSAAHYIAEKTGREVYIVYDARGGESITEWVPATQTRYVGIKTKVQAAIASPALVAAGKTTIDFLIWAQGEENGAGENGMTFETYTTYLTNLDKQFRGDPADSVTYPGESWVEDFTPFFIMGMSPLHDRYMISPALQSFSNLSNGRWRYLSTRSLRTEYQDLGTGDYTHWLGPSLWDGGYNIIGPAFVNNERVAQQADGTLFWNRGNGTANASTSTVISSFDTLISWNSRTSGILLQETASGTGAAFSFVLDYRGTSISEVTVGGVVKTSPTDYSVSTASDGRKTITFVVAPASGTDNIVVKYGASINAVGTTNSFAWGYACYPDGNFTFTGGYVVASSNLSNYSFAYGRELYLDDAGDFGALFGFQNKLAAPYSFAAGRGHTVSDDYGAAVGKFSEYTTTQTDNVLFQVGRGSVATASNAFAARASGTLEAKYLATYASNIAALAGGLVAGQIYKTATGELRIVV